MTNLSDITATVVADSITKTGERITTFELEYPRLIHSELMTHRVFSRNAMSSRAVPIDRMIEQVMKNPAKPVEWGKNKAGMQADGVIDNPINDYTPDEWWTLAAFSASRFAKEFADAGYHKQIANRLLEPFQKMKTVLTSTEFDNFYWLRLDSDADPTIRCLAEKMHFAMHNSTPELLLSNEWHTPYVKHEKNNNTLKYYIENEEKYYLTEKEAIAISSSCCAQVSYRVLNTTYNKAMNIYSKLLSGNKIHASPFEHQAKPMNFNNHMSQVNYYMGKENYNQDDTEWEKGITHCDRESYFWSGNFKGWIQHRQLIVIPKENKE